MAEDDRVPEAAAHVLTRKAYSPRERRWRGILTGVLGVYGFQILRTPDQYRWLVPDAVPFAQGIDVKVENFGAAAGNVFGSVAFYYAGLEGAVAPEPGSAAALIVASTVVLLGRKRRCVYQSLYFPLSPVRRGEG